MTERKEENGTVPADIVYVNGERMLRTDALYRVGSYVSMIDALGALCELARTHDYNGISVDGAYLVSRIEYLTKSALPVLQKELDNLEEILLHGTCCEHCAYGHTHWVVVGERHSDGFEDFACDFENEMSDEDVEMANIGRCPYFSKGEPVDTVDEPECGGDEE